MLLKSTLLLLQHSSHTTSLQDFFKTTPQPFVFVEVNGCTSSTTLINPGGLLTMKFAIKIILLCILFALFSGCGQGGSTSEDPNNDPNANDNPDAPVLSSIGNRSAIPGETVAFTVSAIDPNGLTLTYDTDGSVGSGANPYTETGSLASFNTNNRQFSWNTTGVSTGDYYVQFSVMNSAAHSDSETIRIRIQTDPVLYNEGQTLYTDNCAGSGCHKNLENDTGGFPISCTEADVIQNATDGTLGLKMPEFNFSEDEVMAIAYYLYNFDRDACVIPTP
jgi:hypothetical protein